MEFVCLRLVPHGEADFLGDALHVEVVRKHRRGDALQLFITADLHQQSQQFRAQTVMLPLVEEDPLNVRFEGSNVSQDGNGLPSNSVAL